MEEKIEPALKIRNLTVVFSDEKTGETIKALDGVDLQVGKGVIYGIFGKKGSGKTTLMNVLTGTEEADSGEITIFGEPSAAASARLKTGFVTAEPEFEGFLVGRSLLQRTAFLNGVPENMLSVEIERVIEETSLGALIMKKTKTYTKGQIKRLGIAVALLTGPELLLIDEPSQGCEEIDILWMTGFSKKMNSRGITTIMCSSQMTGIEKLVDKFRFMENGQLTEEVDVSELKPPNSTEKIFADRFGYLIP